LYNAVMQYIKIISIAFFFIIFSCDNQVDSAGKLDHSMVPDNLIYNNGEKWQANPETKEGIEQMIKIIESSDHKTTEELHAELSEELKYIFAECTMKGESHEQLHNYLVPLMADIKKLQNSNANELDSLARRIQAQLNVFDHYFE